MDRPARAQTERVVETHAEHELDYNIWFHKYLGEEKEVLKKKSLTRCDPEKDSGFTDGNKMKNTRICLFFARGSCVLGKKCHYLHKIPGADDEQFQELMHDCFGRERHRTDKEDMSGVGSFSRECKTLFITGATIRGELETQEILTRHFSKFGEITKIRVIETKNICFITYKYRSQAEFAKEAMQNQSLDDNELLDVKWATEKDSQTKKDTLVDQQRVLDAIEQKLLSNNKSGSSSNEEARNMMASVVGAKEYIGNEIAIEQSKEMKEVKESNSLNNGTNPQLQPYSYQQQQQINGVQLSQMNLIPPIPPIPPKPPSFFSRLTQDVIIAVCMMPFDDEMNTNNESNGYIRTSEQQNVDKDQIKEDDNFEQEQSTLNNTQALKRKRTDLSENDDNHQEKEQNMEEGQSNRKRSRLE